MNARLVLDVTGAEVAYGRRLVLAGVDLKIREGEIYVLLGPNGAGKSTLVSAITGQLALAKGRVSIAGRNPATSTEARRALGIVPQHIALYERLTAQENLEVIGRLMGVAARDVPLRARRVLELLGLTDRTRDRVATLSGGMRRRVNIGAALLHEPKLLLLDEPTAGVDHRGRRALRDVLVKLRQTGLAILLTTHDFDEAQALADRVGIILDGRILADGTANELVEHFFGHKQELFLRLRGHDMHRLGRGEAQAVHTLGLAFDGASGCWRGLIEPDSAQLSSLLSHLRATQIHPEEFRLRRPGLDTLMGHMIERQPHS